MKLAAHPPDRDLLVREAKRVATISHKPFDYASATQAAEDAAAWLTHVRRLHQIFKLTHRLEWFRAEIARLR